jgi:hypothetical protein
VPCRTKLAALLLSTVTVAAPAFAQSAPAGQTQSRPGWTVEFYGGLVAGRLSTGGTAALPDPGPPIGTSSPIFPSWQVPSWFFGDGAAFLNNVNEEFDVTERISPLDAALGRSGVAATGALHAGVRFRRPFSDRYALEISADLMPVSARIAGDLESAVEAGRASFASAFAGLFATGPFTGVDIDTSAAISGGSSRDVVLTAAVEQSFAPAGRFTPYVVLGGGLLAQMGTPPSVTVTGRYQFLIDDEVPIQETDQIVLRATQKATLSMVVGGGVRRELAGRWGLSIDARALIGRDPSRLLIDAAPSMTAGMPAGFVESFTYPNLQFSNNASTGRTSTLGGPGLQGFEAFAGGWQTRVRVTVGIFTRF